MSERRENGSVSRLFGLLLLVASDPWAFAASAPDPPEERSLQNVIIFGVSPGPGVGQPRDRIPSNVQWLEPGDNGGLGVPEALRRQAAGVFLGQTQANPFQPDVTYRGFLGSSVLGAPQGLSVFVDGVRVNEFLADTVNFDLIAEEAIASIAIVPGADPLYGRNTLGGALAIETKRGFTHPGSAIELYAGSFGRRRAAASIGGSRGAFDYFATANVSRESGYRDFSEGRGSQLFGQCGWRDDRSDLSLTYAGIHNELRGNGPTAESLLDENRDAVYTQPDLSRPDLHFVNLAGERRLGTDWRAAGNVFFRDLRARQSNADAAEQEAEVVPDAGPEAVPGVLRFTRTEQRRFGGAIQAHWSGRILDRENDFAFGFAAEHGTARLRLVEHSGGIVDARRSVVGTTESALRTDVETDGDSFAAFATDTLTPISWLSVTPAVRYDRTSLTIDDRLGGTASGSHSFARVNPAIGFTVRPDARVDLFSRYSESFRAPTAIELTCSSESAPCPLPIAFAEDPPLRKVRARTYEAGVRLRPPSFAPRLEGLHWAIAFFRTDLDDDILFVSPTRSVGFFQNVPRTRRQGLESVLDGRFGEARWFASYSFTRATFETSEILPSPLGDNDVRPGDVLPGVPDHLLKAGFDSPLALGFRFGLDLEHVGRRFLRTDEANQRAPLGAFTTLSARLEYTRGALTLFARGENLFDTKYDVSGSQGENDFAEGRVERFLVPGAPIGGWFGIRLNL